MTNSVYLSAPAIALASQPTGILDVSPVDCPSDNTADDSCPSNDLPVVSGSSSKAVAIPPSGSYQSIFAGSIRSKSSFYVEPSKEGKPSPVKTPFHLNRWVLFALYTAYSFVNGPAYFSWASMRTMLYISDAYAWQCDTAVTDADSFQYIDSKTEVCKDQQNSVQLLFMLAAAAHFVTSAFAGLLLDSYGPKITAIAGVTTQALGWVLLGSSSKSVQAYVPAVIILGMGVDASFFPCLSIGNLFPKYNSSVIAVIGASRSASFYLIFIMEKIMGDGEIIKMSSICYGFAGLGLGLCLLVAIFLIPMKPFPQQYFPEPQDRQDNRRTSVQTMEAGAEGKARRRSSMALAHHVAVEGGGTVMEEGSRRQSVLGQQARRESFISVSASAAVLQQKPAEGLEATPQTRMERFREFKNEVVSIFYLPILCFFCFTLQRCIFFASSTDVLLVDSLEFFKIASPLSFLPCPLLGWLADIVGIMPVMMICNAAGALLIGFAMIPGIVAAVSCQYLSTVMYCVQVSFLLSQIYCYVADTFCQENMGKLIGLFCAVAGLFMLTAFPMYSYSLDNDFYPMMSFLLITSAMNFFLLGIVWIAKRKAARKALIVPITDMGVDVTAK